LKFTDIDKGLNIQDNNFSDLWLQIYG